MINPMLASSYNDSTHLNFPVIAQPKLDGMRLIIIKQNEKIEFYSRTGKSFPALDWMKELCLYAICNTNCILDGEVTSKTFFDISSSGRKKYEQAFDARITLFDVVNENKFEERYEWLQKNINQTKYINIIENFYVNSKKELIERYNYYLSLHYEGLIIRIPGTHYEFKRCKNILKMKRKETFDLPIVGYVEGTGKIKNMLGALIVKNNGKLVNCGTGFTHKERTILWQNKHLLSGIYVEIEAQEETKDGSLRDPRFKRLRTDKCKFQI